MRGSWRRREDDELEYTFEEWSGECPRQENYMPDWNEDEATHLMLYEITSEGTPLSPALATPEELAKWLADHRVPVWARSTATYSQWLDSIKADVERQESALAK